MEDLNEHHLSSIWTGREEGGRWDHLVWEGGTTDRGFTWTGREGEVRRDHLE